LQWFSTKKKKKRKVGVRMVHVGASSASGTQFQVVERIRRKAVTFFRRGITFVAGNVGAGYGMR
jgi:hypothetical protein